MDGNSSRQHRNRSIRQAVSTSLVSKGSTVVLQFLSLPVAARVLGREEFGVYSTISLAVVLVVILQLGVGPALGRSLAEASSQQDRRRESRLYLNGLLLLSLAALVGFLLSALLITTVPMPSLFGEEYAPFAESMKPALWTGVLLMIGLMMAEMTDRVREGYMETASVNLSSAAGNLVGAIVILVGIQFQPSVSFLLVAVFGPNILARFVNTVLLLRKRPWLIAGKIRPDRSIIVELIRDGLAFSMTSFLVYLVEFTIAALIIGRVSGPHDVAIFEILTAFTTAYTGMLLMVGRPIWGAIVDAKAKGDSGWLVSTARRYYGYLAALFAIASIGLIGLGPWIVEVLYGEEFLVERGLFVAHSVFLLAIGWRHVNRYLAIGLGLIAQTVKPVFSGLVLGLFLAVIGKHELGMPGLFYGFAAGALAIPGIVIPRLVWKSLGQITKSSGEIEVLDGQTLATASEGSVD